MGAVALAACGDGGARGTEAIACALSEDQVEEVTGMTVEEMNDEPTSTDFGASCGYDGTFGFDTGPAGTDSASVVIRVYDTERGAEIYDETRADGRDVEAGLVTDELDMAIMQVEDRHVSASIRHELPRNMFGDMAELLRLIRDEID